ncbi:hypothetical protein SZ25_00438, partial [Candidatus Arcanobacter lacustris]
TGCITSEIQQKLSSNRTSFLNATKPYKSFNGAKQTITGIEITHMIKKRQLKTSNQNNNSIFNQFISLVV